MRSRYGQRLSLFDFLIPQLSKQIEALEDEVDDKAARIQDLEKDLDAADRELEDRQRMHEQVVIALKEVCSANNFDSPKPAVLTTFSRKRPPTSLVKPTSRYSTNHSPQKSLSCGTRLKNSPSDALSLKKVDDQTISNSNACKTTDMRLKSNCAKKRLKFSKLNLKQIAKFWNSRMNGEMSLLRKIRL